MFYLTDQSKDEQGNVLGVVVVARDITDQKIIETN
jgi:PAS domain-containing protein